MFQLNIGKHFRQLFKNRVRRRPCGLEAQAVTVVVIYTALVVSVGVPLGSPIPDAPLVPCGRAELPDIIPGGFAQLPFFAADICPLAEENFFALRRDVFKRFKGVIG